MDKELDDYLLFTLQGLRARGMDKDAAMAKLPEYERHFLESRKAQTQPQAASQAPAAPPPSRWEEFKGDLGDVADGAVGAAKAVGGAASDAMNWVAPVLEGANDTLTFGAWPKISNAMSKHAPSLFASQARLDEMAADAPLRTSFGKGAGLAASSLAGPGRLTAQVGAGLSRMAGTSARPIVGSMVSGAGDAAMQSLATTAVDTAAGERNLTTAKGWEDAGVDLATDAAVGAGASGALSTVARGVGAVAKPVAKFASDKLRDTRSLLGRYIDTLGRTKPYRDSAEYKELMFGMPGITQQSTRAGGELGEMQAKLLREANEEWAKGHAKLMGRDELHDVSNVVRAADGQVKRFSNKKVANPEIQAVAQEVRGNLSRDITEYVPAKPTEAPTPAPGARPAGPIERRALPGIGETGPDDIDLKRHEVALRIFNESRPHKPLQKSKRPDPAPRRQPTKSLVPQKRYGFPDEPVSPAPVDEAAPPEEILMEPQTRTVSRATLDDLILEKQRLQESAEFGQAATKENRPYRQVYRELVKEIEKISPEMAAIDKRYMQKMEVLEEVNGTIFGAEDAKAVLTGPGAKLRGGQYLSTALADTKASGLRAEQLERVRELDPENYGPIIDKVLAKVADEGTKFGGVNVFGHTGKWGGVGQSLSQNSNALLARKVDPLLQNILTQLPPEALQAPTRVAARSAMGTGVMKAREKDREAAERLKKLRSEASQRPR